MDCPNCHYQLADDVSECKSCGYTIRSEEPHHALDYSSSPSVINEQVPVGLNPDPEDSSTLAPDTPTPPSPTPVVHSNNTFTGTVGMPFDNTGATTNIPQTNRVSETKTAVPPLEPNRIQRWLLRYLPAHLVDNPILNVSLGALIAGVLNILAFIFLLALINAAIPYIPANIHVQDQQATVYNWLAIDPMYSLWRESMELLLTAHSIQHSLQPYLLFSTSTSNSLFVQAFQIPLYGLLFIPACFLILGGYIAASGDMQNRTRAILLRGVSIALPYTLLLLFIALLTNGPIPIEGNYGAYYNNTYTLRIDITSLLVFGLLWGALFGLIGASLKLARGHWRAMFYGAIQHSQYRRRLSIVSGAGAAFLLGLLLSLFCVMTALMLPSILTPLLTQTSCPVLTQSSWQILCWSLIQGPQYAAYLFMASLGAPITVTNTLGGGNSIPLQCLSPIQTPSMSMNLLGSLGQIQHIWLILLVALPAISLFIGGRMSVALDRTQTRNSSLIQGALISIPFALLVALLAQINTSTWTNFSAGIGIVVSSQNPTQAIGVSPGAAFLWALITGALFGALGGLYQQSTFKTTLSTKISRLTGPVRLFCQPFFFILDRLTAQSHKQQRSRARTLLYGAVLLSILLLTISIFGGILLILFSQILTAAQNHTIHDILAASLILLPGLAIVSAIAFALSYDQNTEAQLQPEPKNPDPSNQLSSGLEEEHRNHATI